MHDANVLPYGSDAEQPDDDMPPLVDTTTDPYHVDPDETDDEVMRAAGYVPLSEHAEKTEPYYVVGDTPAFRRTGVTDRQAAGLDPLADRFPARDGWAPTGIVNEPGIRIGLDVSPHSDGFDADEHNRPRNGLGTYSESDGAW